MIKRATTNVLIIDDDLEILEMTRKYVETFGYNVITAIDGVSGIAAMDQNNIDIVICDIVMPNMDGLEFLSLVRRYNIKTQVIMVTGQPTLENCVGSIERDACQYLTKPFNRREMLRSIARAERNIREKADMLKKGLSLESKV